MMYILYLPKMMNDCPEGWKNFVISVRPEIESLIIRDTDNSVKNIINKSLRIYDATFNNYTLEVLFQSEEGLLLFNLRFGFVNAKLKSKSEI